MFTSGDPDEEAIAQMYNTMVRSYLRDRAEKRKSSDSALSRSPLYSDLRRTILDTTFGHTSEDEKKIRLWTPFEDNIIRECVMIDEPVDIIKDRIYDLGLVAPRNYHKNRFNTLFNVSTDEKKVQNLTDKQYDTVRQMLFSGHSVDSIARKLRIPKDEILAIMYACEDEDVWEDEDV